MLVEAHIDRLTSALAADKVLQESFLADPVAAIAAYNKRLINRWGERPVELNSDEIQLLLTLQASSIQEVFVQLVEALDNQLRLPIPMPVRTPNYAGTAAIA